MSHYFMKWLSFGGHSPLAIARGVAAFNAFALGVGLWLARRSPRYFMTLVACATSVILILYSRKVWNPDLQAAWICLGIGFLGSAFERETWTRFFAAGLCFVISGHMYLPGALVGAVCTLAVGWSLGRRPDRGAFQAWVAGCGLGWLSFLPYVLAILTHPADALAAPASVRAYNWTLAWKLLSSSLTLPAPWTLYAHYFRPAFDVLGSQGGSVDRVMGMLLILSTGVIWSGLFWLALARIWARRGDAFRDPLVVSGVALLAAVPGLLFLSRMGHYTHYWLPVLPLAFYLISWAAAGDRTDVSARVLRRGVWLGCLVSLATVFHFQTLVHRFGGLSGEYGATYTAQTTARGPEP